MKTFKTLCLSLLIGTSALAAAKAQPLDTNSNPALLYYQAFLLAPQPWSEADDDYLYSRESGQKLPEHFGKLSSGYDNQFKLVRQAARCNAPCDWGIDMSEGPAALCPHYACAKAVSIAGRLRVMWALQEGREADACGDLLGTFVLGRNVSRDGTLISALVQSAIEAMAYSEVAGNFGRFSPESLKQLVAGFDAAPAHGTVAASLMAEKPIIRDWTVNKILELQKNNPGEDAKVMENIRQIFTVNGPGTLDTNAWKQILVTSGGTSDGVLKLAREAEPFAQKLAVILALPYPEFETRMKEFNTSVQNNPFVLSRLSLFSELCSAFEKGRKREFRMQVWQAMVRAAVEYKLHGDAGLQNVVDPCGSGPFAFQRFVFEGVDRGFELKSAYTGSGFPERLIFVEKEGPAFMVDGPHAGQAQPEAKK